MQDLKFRYLIYGELCYYTMNEIEAAMACSEVLSKAYAARDIFIGEKDRNGKDIYENDFVRFIQHRSIWSNEHNDYLRGKFTFIRQVKYEDCCFDADLSYYDDGAEWKDVEVIGNIHENKDIKEDIIKNDKEQYH